MPALLNQALAFTTLRDAWHRVRDNKGCAGGDGETLKRFEADLEINLAALRNEVLQGRYAPRPLLSVIVESAGKKPRRLAVPAVRDRVLQTAAAIVLTPLFEAEFEECSFAYRRGRSVDLAVRRIMHYRDQGFRWVVDADIASFFAEIDQERLVREVAELVQDVRIIDLITIWLKAPITDGEKTWRPTKGIALGSPVSPLLANLYLDHLDEALLGEDLRLVRFSDDFLILCTHEEQAKRALDLTEEVLDALQLRLNREKTRIVDFERGFRFLGVEFVRNLVLQCRASDEPPDYAEMLPEEPGADEPIAQDEGAAVVPAEPVIPGALALAIDEAFEQQHEHKKHLHCGPHYGNLDTGRWRGQYRKCFRGLQRKSCLYDRDQNGIETDNSAEINLPTKLAVYTTGIRTGLKLEFCEDHASLCGRVLFIRAGQNGIETWLVRTSIS